MKKRTVPPVIRQTEALLRRLPEQHPKRELIEKDVNRRWAGYRGEQALDYFLRFLPFSTYRIFHDLRLNLYGNSFQIDTLVLTPNVGFLIEVKNLAGVITVDEELGQFTVVKQGITKKYQNPLAQVNRQLIQLKQWFQAHEVYTYPIVPLVSISNPNTELHFKDSLSVPITQLDVTIERIKKLYAFYENKKSFSLDPIERSLLRNHRPFYSDILKMYSIPSSLIQTGIQCPVCKEYGMARIKLSWECPDCSTRSRQAHRLALADYFLLYGSTLTNKRCQEFLGIRSRHAVAKLLSRMPLSYTGSTNALTYVTPSNIEELIPQ
ncbi:MULTISPECIES: nuclease-related domain-containing protein [Pontibacillus]|uniref:Nuclease-related domain-containing protein n=1 Tax=Pontibacillus chungwhensis TaxID=265426 RepID=A0ABY8UYR6_9BACI|nr:MULTISPECIES: nuclease-related domain-containing protein [Pontibacillus]MCD5324861.1 NERD domain-containing protein [Pontibacillus sp. HN14]WIF98822.1 nuclease-related domain-containing protein [Pontibacillus chungwhensis]